MALPRLYDFTAGQLAVGDEVDAEFERVNALLEGISGAAAGADAYQKGVVSPTDWATEAGGSIGAGTGIVTEVFGGAAWLPGPSGSLVRTFTPPAAHALKPPVLPAPGGYVCVGFELTASGDEAVVSVVSAGEQLSAAAALAAPPAVSAEKVRIFDIVVHNNAGTYEAPLSRDRRPWALRAFAQRTLDAETLNNAAFTAMTSLDTRVEVGAGERVRVTLVGEVESFSDANAVLLRIGATATAAENPIWRAGLGNGFPQLVFAQALYTNVHGAIAGSRLFHPEYKTIASASFKNMVLTVEELRSSANNGTS